MKFFLVTFLAITNFFSQPFFLSDKYDISIDVSVNSDKIFGELKNPRNAIVGFPHFPNAKLFFVSIHGENGQHLYFPSDIKGIFFNQLTISGDLTNRKLFKAGPNNTYSSGQLFFPYLFKGPSIFDQFMKESVFPEDLEGKQFGYFLMRKPLGERGVFFSEIFSFKLKDDKIFAGSKLEIPPDSVAKRIFFEQQLWKFLVYFIKPGDQIEHFGDDKVDGYLDYKTFPLFLLILNGILCVM